ncbi:hypothetical protein LENED_002960 [Lentinula edodes]|uniref:F-box domain-containing protein n=1 Tax=Lentinula edodes TaxID=5353 RepID=A0A1Q3E284_LENED|nr:hypothetical protein LENED_002960 [Lentinula edodes]
MSPAKLLNFPEDILISIFTFLNLPDILNIRQTCRRLNDTANLKIVWLHTWETHILHKWYPFPAISSELFEKNSREICKSDKGRTSIQNMSRAELEQRTRHAYRLGKRLFLLCYLTETSAGRDHGSEADLAVSVVCEGRHEIDLFNISDVGELLPICTVPSVPMCASTLGEEANIHSQAMQPMKPMTLSGSLLAMSDDTASTVIYNWKTGAFAVLEHEEDEIGVWKHDHIIQVVFAYRSVLVVRARSLHLFPEPELYLASPSSVANSNFLTSPGLPNIYSPIANHSFGWVDGVSVVSMYPDCSSDNPWMSNEHSLDLYELSLNPNFFPPICTSRVTSSRGPLRCTDLILGRCGTAMWVKPGDRTTHGLLASDMYDDYTYVARLGGLESGIVTMGGGATESLVAGIFPGPLNPDETVRTRKIYTNVSKDWTALDYDEAIGRVVLGDATGCVRILEL